MKEYRVTDRSLLGYEEAKVIHEGNWPGGIEGYRAFLADCRCEVVKVEVREVSEWEEV